ncbi:MAG: hypothetical protein COV76_03780 [Candidatus Omnitrophica bacterium CG11_big_fil_rev_8_21_14_0_20_64_10]|nr:MAG: hypothetical protein COV76_03780 [Candidatus Omnitrophica bacterium CG11_big_fil_rev_8_21_14_0_20_64_10]
MLKRFLTIGLLAAGVISVSGCAVLLVGAGAGGTALWQGGKVISEETVTRDRAVAAVKSAFKARKITLTDEVKKTEVTQLRGEDAAHRKVAVDCFETGKKAVRVEIRVGMGEQDPAQALLTDIKRRL